MTSKRKYHLHLCIGFTEVICISPFELSFVTNVTKLKLVFCLKLGHNVYFVEVY